MLLILSLFPIHSSAAEELDPLFISATRAESSRVFVPSAIGSISGETLEQKGGKLEEALRAIPGVTITQNGGPGQTRSLLLRGAKAEHTLVLVDGVAVNDPLSPSRNFDFGQIPVDQIERIEVLRGPQSVLYGSDAMGGVVQIFTKKGSESAKARLEYGSYESFKSSLSAYGFHGSYERSAGFSAADERDGNKERDGHRAFRLGGRKDYSLGENTRWGLQGNYADSKTDTDSAGGPGGDSAGTLARQSQLLFRSDLTHMDSHDFQWDGALSIQARDREDNTSGPSFFRARLWKTELRTQKKIHQHALSLGAEYQQESGRGTGLALKRKAGTLSFFAQDHLQGKELHGSLGARLDKHDRHGTASTGRASVGIWVSPESFRLKGSLGTGYKAPSLFQLFSNFGNAGLKPERSLGWDAGLELREKNWAWEFFWYQNRFRDLIDFDLANSRYKNIGLSDTRGLETSFSVQEAPWSWKNSFTTIRSRDRLTRLKLLRRPEFSFNSEVALSEETHHAAIQMQWTGPRDDSDPITFARKRMPQHVVFGLSGWWRFQTEYRFLARIENLTDRKYQETAGYGTAGRSFFVGVEGDL
jgi:vitamin B12 transporter